MSLPALTCSRPTMEKTDQCVKSVRNKKSKQQNDIIQVPLLSVNFEQISYFNLEFSFLNLKEL